MEFDYSWENLKIYKGFPLFPHHFSLWKISKINSNFSNKNEKELMNRTNNYFKAFRLLEGYTQMEVEDGGLCYENYQAIKLIKGKGINRA